MRASDLHPEVRNAIRWTPRIPFAHPVLFGLSRRLYNIGSSSKLPKGVSAHRETLVGVEVLVIRPETPVSDAAILWMFGGGHWAGKPEHLNATAGRAARDLGVTVFVPDYRLAPEHPFPADLDDCYTVWQWLVSNGHTRGIDPSRMALAGHSAGGGIAAALAQRILDNGGTQPVAQCLYYPMLDDRPSADRSLDKPNHFVWNNKADYQSWRAYLKPNQPNAQVLPAYAAPARRLDLSGLPTTWIGMCALDLFHPQYATYAKRLNADGVSCEIYEVPGVPHAFEVFSPKASIARSFESAAIGFLQRVLRC
ncbi:alpha/beta hydrolase fold domain-containing protein [uncultured Sulfitobacter sp.]|uniref:alpha/beta hydrolase fold domain-containing protein n=1 Tax=uncultured Sulfitobacter sp. TaxID=191468 RepID=UPI00262A5E55|nr:alpha/beta hydrolase fold domain-containing protein [uncultured Sulfitobacter sp.]